MKLLKAIKAFILCFKSFCIKSIEAAQQFEEYNKIFEKQHKDAMNEISNN